MEDLLKYYAVPPDAAMIVPATEEQKRKVAELNQRVKENVLRIQNSSEFRDFLIAMSHFHNYSWNNQMLIWIQRPDATHVAGYNTWADLGRQVKAGEKGIAILAPLGLTSATSWIRVTDNTVYAIKRQDFAITKGWAIYNEHEDLVEGDFPSYAAAGRQLKEMGFVEHKQTLSVHNFKVVYVFDMSQTTGKPLPEFEVPILSGETNPVLFEQLLQLAKDEGVTVSFDPKDADSSPSTRGYYRPPKFIWIRPTELPAQQLNVISHELAHYFTEEVFKISRADAETIADSVAYIVDAHYGFDSGAHSFAYVALWARDEKTLHANLNTIQKVAEKIIDTLEARKTRLVPSVISNQADKKTIEEWEKKYSLQDLKRMAREKGFDISGTKREIIERILRGQWRMKM